MFKLWQLGIKVKLMDLRYVKFFRLSIIYFIIFWKIFKNMWINLDFNLHFRALIMVRQIQLLMHQVIWISMSEERLVWITLLNFQVISRCRPSNKFLIKEILDKTHIKLYWAGKIIQVSLINESNIF